MPHDWRELLCEKHNRQYLASYNVPIPASGLIGSGVSSRPGDHRSTCSDGGAAYRCFAASWPVGTDEEDIDEEWAAADQERDRAHHNRRFALAMIKLAIANLRRGNSCAR